MVDSSWDNGGTAPPAQSGMPVWAKVLLGCGVAAVLALATCVGGGAYFFSRVSHAMKGREWTQLRTVSDALQTDEGTRLLYQQNPGLAADYATESDFLKAIQAWRPRLEPLPMEMPGLMTGRIAYNVRKVGGRPKQVELGYRNGKGVWLKVRWEGDRLVSLDLS